MNKKNILGFDVCVENEDTLLENIFNDYKSNNQIFVASINPEIVTKNHKNKYLKNEFNKQRYQIPDGTGIVWAIKKKYNILVKRITGIDLMLKICETSMNYNARIFLYGAKEGISAKAKQELENLYHNINIVGCCSGYEDEKLVIDKINSSMTDILFVALGSPKQEQFIIDNMDKLKNIKIFMPVGGSFDVISKVKKRAPNWIIKLNLEWLYRLFKEPKRFFRQLQLIKFIYLVIKNKENENERN